MCVWENTRRQVFFRACALNFLWILNISGSNKESKKRKKISGSIFFGMKATIPGTHGTFNI